MYDNDGVAQGSMKGYVVVFRVYLLLASPTYQGSGTFVLAKFMGNS